MPSAAVVIIGDEILSGKFPDENGPYLIGRLRALGCDLRRLSTVSDAVEEIAAEVALCAGRHDHVLTTGGVGPTHDDRTLAGVAMALGVALEPRPELLALLDRFGLPRTETNLRMATVPSGATLEWPDGAPFPTIRAGNVWIFPGVPRLLRAKFEEVHLAFVGERVRTARVHTDQPETEIAAFLEAVANAFPTVSLGSYPRHDEGNFRVLLTLESRDDDALSAAHAALRAGLSVVEP